MKDQIKRVYLSGKTMQETATEVGCSKAYVQVVIARAGIKRPGKGFNKLVRSDIEKAQRRRLTAKKGNIKSQLKLPCSLKYSDLNWPEYCPVLGIKLDYFASDRQENSPSFDRTNPKLGYIKGNVKIISWRANRIKNDGTAEEHIQIANYLTNIC